MLKKSVFIATLVGAACISISNIGYAASFTGWDKMVAPHKRPIKYRYPYIRLGGGIYDFKTPKTEVGTAGSTTAPLIKIDNTKITPFYNLAVGYAFYNSGASWFTRSIARVFGHDNAVELQLDYFNVSKKKDRFGNIGTGNIWWINGNGTFTIDPTTIRSARLNAKHRYINGGLYYKGRWITKNPRITFMPRAGAILTNLKQKYHYVHAKLNASQNILVGSVPAGNRVTVKNSKSAFTYRAILAVGGEYKINNKINSPSVEVKGGIDRWGYSPKVVPPNNAGSGPIHIVGTQQNNYFANIGVTIPIG